MIFGNFMLRRRDVRLYSFSVFNKSVVRLYYLDYISADSSIQLSAYYNVRNCFLATKSRWKKSDSTSEDTGDIQRRHRTNFTYPVHRVKQT